MRAVRLMVLVLGIALLCGGVAEAKKGGGKGRGKAKAAKFSKVESVRIGASGRARSSFPPGNAWGLRRNLGQNLPLGSPARFSGRVAPLDGERIFRAGREWEFDALTNSWILLP